jgi:hypothetical protein
MEACIMQNANNSKRLQYKALLLLGLEYSHDYLRTFRICLILVDTVNKFRSFFFFCLSHIFV